MKKIASIALLLAFCLSCHTIVVEVDKEGPGKVVRNEWYKSWALGLIEGAGQVPNPELICPNGIYKFTMQLSGLNALIAALPYVSYVISFRTNVIQCKVAPSSGPGPSPIQPPPGKKAQ